VVIDDFDFMGTVSLPTEANAPLVIDADGVPAFAVALEGFQPVAWRDGKVVQCGDGVELGEFPQGDALNIGRERPGFPFLEEEGCLLASEGTNHSVTAIVTPRVMTSI